MFQAILDYADVLLNWDMNLFKIFPVNINAFITHLKMGVTILQVYQNWHAYFADYFGLVKRGHINYVLRNGVTYKTRSGTYDRSIIDEVWIRGLYTPGTIRIGVSDTVVDIGGQIGVFSIYAGRFANCGKVLAFEPAPDNFRLLEDNLELNNCRNIIAVNKAVSDQDGRKDIILSSANTGGHSFFNLWNEPSAQHISVHTISLKSIFAEYHIQKIDYLKLDCEGAEYEILFGSSHEQLQNIRTIGMEYHNLDERRSGETLRAFLAQNGFAVSFDHNNMMMFACRNA